MPINLTRERGVGVITMDRPPANSYDVAFARELGVAIDDARIDEEVGAVVLRSASEKFFSAGADVGAFQKGSPRQRWMTVLLMHEVLRKMETTPLIFIAEIAGHALGGGLEIALACDFRFAANGDYKLGLPEVNLGLFPGNGGTQRLPRLVGKSKGLELIVKARTFSPEGAEKLGVVDRLFDNPEKLRDMTLDYAAELAAGPREAIGRAKVTTQLGYDAPLGGDQPHLRLRRRRRRDRRLLRKAQAEVQRQVAFESNPLHAVGRAGWGDPAVSPPLGGHHPAPIGGWAPGEYRGSRGEGETLYLSPRRVQNPSGSNLRICVSSSEVGAGVSSTSGATWRSQPVSALTAATV